MRLSRKSRVAAFASQGHGESGASDFVEKSIRLEDLPDTLNVGVGADATVDDYYRATARALGWTGAFRSL